MENFLINYLLKNCVTLAKEFFSTEKAAIGEGDNGLDFLNLLEVKMGSGVTTSEIGATTSTEGIGDEVVSRDKVSQGKESEASGDNIKKEDDLKGPAHNFLDTQGIMALFQTYLKTQNTEDKDNTAPWDNSQSVTIKKFLHSVFSLLQEGESVQFSKEKSMGVLSLAQTSKEQEATIETDRHPVIEGRNGMENSALISYLASILQKFDVSEKTGENAENEEAGNKDVNENEHEKAQKIEVIRMFGTTGTGKSAVKVTDELVKPLLNRSETSAGLKNESNENKDFINRADTTVKPFNGIEVKKLNGGENLIQTVSDEPQSSEGEEMKKNVSVLAVKMGRPTAAHNSSLPEFLSGQPLSGENEEMNKNISITSVKAEKAASSVDGEVARVTTKISEKAANDGTGADGRQLLSQNDYSKTGAHLDKEAGKVSEKAPFTSIMSDRIEKIVEQYANKNISMDMVVRLRIDEKETLLVGLKEQGQRVTVEVKTTNEGMGTFLQSQKEEIVRQLEGKHVYANIYVDVQNENSQKRDQRNNQKKRNAEQEKQDFSGFLEATA